MAKKKSKKNWIKGHLKDPYVKLANKEKLKSRASFKLKQINEKYKVIKSGDAVIDLGAAPGGWSQIAKGILKDTGLIIALDLLPVTGVPGIKFILGDIYADEVMAQVDDLLRESGRDKVELVMSDMAPNLSGIAASDAARANDLNMRALFYAEKYLAKKASFVVKLFQNEYFKDYSNEVKKLFSSCSIYKPDASRQKSSEIYLVAKNKK